MSPFRSRTRLRHLVIGLAALALALPGVAVLGTAAQAATGIGVGVTDLAIANINRTACGLNSLGTTGFDTSCTGNGGQPENWGADFVAWDWAQEGISTAGLLTSAGGSNPALFAKYGGPSGSVHSSPLYAPQPGDAIVYDSPADYVAIVTAVNSDGSIQTVDGDWGGEGPGASSVLAVTIPSGQTAVGSSPDPMNGKTISAYVTPTPLPNSTTSLIPFGADTWTPPGGSARTDILAADPHGVLWDFTHTVGSTAPLGTPAQAEANWGHYRAVGLADWNEDGYPDIVAIDTTNNTMQVFLGSANGFAQTSVQIGVGWSSDFRIMGIADWNHDGHLDIIAVTLSNGDEWMYPGDLKGGTGVQVEIGGGFNNSAYGAVGAGTITGDGYNGLLTCRSDTNAMLLYPGDVTGGKGMAPWGNGIDVWDGCDGYTFFGLTDYTGDGQLDVIARDNATGALVVNPGTGAVNKASSIGTVILPGNLVTRTWKPVGTIAWTPPGSATPRVDVYLLDHTDTLWDYQKQPDGTLGQGTQLATEWTQYRPVGVADWNHDGYPDVIMINTTNNTMQVFLGSATGLSTTPTQIGGGWTSDYQIMGLADWTHDGHLGIIATTVSNGDEWFYPGDLTGGVAPQIQIGGGFTSSYLPVGVADVTGDGHYDLLTCQVDDNMLLLFAGDKTGGQAYGDGTTRMVGCNRDTAFGLVDYNGDGHPDLITMDQSTGSLILDTGTGAGWWQDNSTTTIATNF